MVGPEFEIGPTGQGDVEAAHRSTNQPQPRNVSSKRPVMFTLRSAKSFILLVAIFAWFTASFP